MNKLVNWFLDKFFKPKYLILSTHGVYERDTDEIQDKILRDIKSFLLTNKVGIRSTDIGIVKLEKYGYRIQHDNSYLGRRLARIDTRDIDPEDERILVFVYDVDNMFVSKAGVPITNSPCECSIGIIDSKYFMVTSTMNRYRNFLSLSKDMNILEWLKVKPLK